uniref:Uncharacterized protein n=1 Tax=Panagrolaimus sp. JU765 TaxID=591449 RepID=A0AC34QI18_9BILA
MPDNITKCGVTYDDYKLLLNKYQNVIKKLEECRSFNESLHEMYLELVKEHQNALDLLKKNCIQKPQDVKLSPTTFTLTDSDKTDLTPQQIKKRNELIRRSNVRLLKIKEASKQRAVVAAAMREFGRLNLSGYDSTIHDLSDFAALAAKMNSIEAFPMCEIRRETYNRLVHFGVFEDFKHKQRERECKALCALLSACAAEETRRKLLSCNLYEKPINVEKFRRHLC